MRFVLTSILFCLIIQVAAQAKGSEFLNLAIKYTETGRFEEAIRVCDKLIVLDSTNADVFYLRGVNRFLLKDYEGSIIDFDKAIELNPNHPDAYLKRAKAKKETKNYMGALRDYNQAKNENFAQTITSLAGDLIRSVFSGD